MKIHDLKKVENQILIKSERYGQNPNNIIKKIIHLENHSITSLLIVLVISTLDQVKLLICHFVCVLNALINGLTIVELNNTYLCAYVNSKCDNMTIDTLLTKQPIFRKMKSFQAPYD